MASGVRWKATFEDCDALVDVCILGRWCGICSYCDEDGVQSRRQEGMVRKMPTCSAMYSKSD
jgi:hypothetical protein